MNLGPDSPGKLADGEPGDFFLTTTGEQWAIWKILDGDDLVLARKLGYDYPKVASLVLVGDELNPPLSPKTDESDPPSCMEDPTQPMLVKADWTYLGKL